MLRFAPSPTGDMNITSLRIALFNYLVAHQRKEELIVRIDDTDKQNNVEGKDQEILDTLDLFGISYSQVIYQSQNVRFHSAMALQLVHEKKAFSCFCSDEWLAKKKEEAKVANKVYLYDDACRSLPAELVIDNTNPFTIRITRPDSAIVVDDKVQGKMNFEQEALDSFIILSQTKIPTYNFSSAVDDMLNDISLVIRSEDHIDKAPIQEHIRDSLSYNKKIEYAHIPNILDNDSLSVKSLLERGFLPEAISNYLISIGTQAPKEIFTIAQAIEWFDLSKISTSPAPFDMEMLKYINREHLKLLDVKELSRYVGFADAEIGELARVYLQDVYTTRELKDKIAPIFTKRTVPEALKESTDIIKAIIIDAPYFDQYEEFKSYIMKESALKEEIFADALYILLTNAQDGPDIAEIYKYIKNYIGEIVK
ncbi:MAG: glutamate--tRNA ligase [Sulfurimonas sp.]|nr:glutamate--tRNA ligase [Sulfurimonas sp.]